MSLLYYPAMGLYICIYVLFGIFRPFRGLSGTPLQPNGPEAHLGCQEGGADQFGELAEGSFA